MELKVLDKCRNDSLIRTKAFIKKTLKVILLASSLSDLSIITLSAKRKTGISAKPNAEIPINHDRNSLTSSSVRSDDCLLKNIPAIP